MRQGDTPYLIRPNVRLLHDQDETLNLVPAIVSFPKHYFLGRLSQLGHLH